MLTTALLILEVNLAFKPFNNSFHTMAKATLGRPGQIIAWITCLLLLYSLTAAYMTGNGSLMSEAINTFSGVKIPDWINTLIFTFIFGGIVYWNTYAVDVFNRALISIKGLALIITLVLLLPHINWTMLISQPHSNHYLWAAAPVFLTAFGFHTSIPSLTNYIGPNKKALKWVIIIGATIPLIIYIIWLFCTLGIIGLHAHPGFTNVLDHNNSVGTFVKVLDKVVHSNAVTVSVNVFSNIAMTTSFLGVTLGLFDFIADACKT